MPANLQRRSPDVETQDSHFTAIGCQQAQQSLDHRALARSIRTEQADGTAGKRRAHIAQRPLGSIADADMLQIDDWRHRLTHTFGPLESFGPSEAGLAEGGSGRLTAFLEGRAGLPVRAET